MLITILAVVAATVFVAIVVANLVSYERQVKYTIEHVQGLEDAQIEREINVILGRPFVDGNAVEHLCNGQQIFPAMLSAIRDAQTTICFETFIYWSGDIAQQFADCLSERAQSGVAVNVLLDWSGSIGVDDELIKSMLAAGINLEYYHPLRWYQAWRMNNRTHRKLLLIDGKLGFIGGVGIADEWMGDAQDPAHWRDSHFRVQGPVVGHMQAAFLDNWLKTSGRLLRGKGYFPELNVAGDLQAQVLASSPSGGSESMHLLYMMNLSAARISIDLAAAYFVPDSLSLRTIIQALERGVRVRILVPGEHIDSFWVHYASRDLRAQLLKAGAEIYEYQPTMYHVKMLIVDELTTSVGSTNFDNRSFRLNNEASLNVLDRDFAQQMTAIYENDLSKAKRVSLAEWRERPLYGRALESIAARFASQL